MVCLFGLFSEEVFSSNFVEREKFSLSVLFLVLSLLKQNAKLSFLCFEFVSISAKPSTKHSLLVGIRIHSIELPYPFTWVDKSKIVKIHGCILKSFFLQNSQSFSTKDILVVLLIFFNQGTCTIIYIFAQVCSLLRLDKPHWHFDFFSCKFCFWLATCTSQESKHDNIMMDLDKIV